MSRLAALHSQTIWKEGYAVHSNARLGLNISLQSALRAHRISVGVPEIHGDLRSIIRDHFEFIEGGAHKSEHLLGLSAPW
jgi:hypothetical protein